MISIIQALIIIFVAAPLLVKRALPFLFPAQSKEGQIMADQQPHQDHLPMLR